jgi:hypothetical protein
MGATAIGLRWTRRGQTAIAHLCGDLHATAAQGVIDAMIGGAGDLDLVVDLTDVTFLESTTLSAVSLLARQRHIRIVAPAADRPRRALRVARLIEIVPTFETVDAAAVVTPA